MNNIKTIATSVLFMLLAANTALSQSQISELKIPITYSGATLGDLAGMYVELEDSSGPIDSATVDEQGYANFYFAPAGEPLTLRVFPGDSYDPQFVNPGLCSDARSIDLTFPGSNCESYDPGSTPGLDDVCEWQTITLTPEASQNILRFQVISVDTAFSGALMPGAAPTPVVGASVYVGSEDGSFNAFALTDQSGFVNFPSCGELEIGSRLFVDVQPEDKSVFAGFEEVVVRNPISSTLSVVELSGGANSFIQANLVNPDGSSFVVPSGTFWSDISCHSVFDPSNPNDEPLPGTFEMVDEGESSATLQVLAPASPDTVFWACSYNSDQYQSASTEVEISAGETKQINLTVLTPIAFPVTLQDDQGNPVSVPVYVDANGTQDDSGVFTNHGWSERMGEGVNQANFSLLEGSTYEIWINQAYDDELDPGFPAQAANGTRAVYYLFDNGLPSKFKVGSGPGEVSSYVATVKTTSSVINVTASSPSGPMPYAWADIFCFKEGADQTEEFFGEVYGGSLDANGSGNFGIPDDGKTCEVQVFPSYDPENPDGFSKLIPTEGRRIITPTAPNQAYSAAFSFAAPNYTLTVDLQVDGQAPDTTTDRFSYCDATSPDGRTTWGDSFESGNPNQISIGFIAKPKETWQIFCFSDFFDFNDPNGGGEFFESFFAYVIKSGVSEDNTTATLKKFGDAFDAEISFQNQQDVTLSSPYGSIVIKALTFGESGSTTLKISNLADEAKKARPTGGNQLIYPNLSFTFLNGSGEEVQPKKPVKLRYFVDETRVSQFGGDTSQIVVAHNVNGVWVEEPTRVYRDDQGRLIAEAEASNFSVWNNLVDLLKPSAGGSTAIEKPRAKRTTKKGGAGKKVNYQISCANEIAGIYSLRHRAIKPSKKAKKKKTNNTAKDPWAKAKVLTSESCEFNVKLKKGSKYEYQLRRNNDAWSKGKKVNVKNN